MSNLKTCSRDGSGNVITCEGRLSYAYLLEPNPKAVNKTNGKLGYTTSIVFPPGSDLTAAKEAAKEVVEEEFPNPEKRPKTLKSPFLNAAEKMGDEWEGWTLLRVKTYQQPGIIDASGADVTDPKQVYSGRWARISARAYFYDQDGNKGVGFALQNVQLLRHDEPLGGAAPKATSQFGAVDVPEDNPFN